MNPVLRGIPAAILALVLPCCSLFPEKEKKDSRKEPATQSKLVGRIASVAVDRKFVMIQSYGPWSVPAGSILTTQGPDNRVSNLRCTGEKLGQYAAADIQSGLPQSGDAVFTSPELPSKPGESNSPKPPEGFTPSFNSGTSGGPSLPQVP